MRPPSEPRLARVAAAIADPARSRMLALLLSGRPATAGELARAASVTPATASGHLMRLLDAGFVVRERRGRHAYYRLADAEVAHALEALALVAERDNRDAAWDQPDRRPLRTGRACYGHLAGKLGVQLFDTLIGRRLLEPAPDGFVLNAAGRAWLADMGLAPSPAGRQRRQAYACMDWSERRDHLAGQLADEMLAHFLARGWLRPGPGRVIELTPTGLVEWLPRLQAAGAR